MRILGIEFGSWSLKGVEMESRFRRLDILDFHEVRLPLKITNPLESYQEAMAELLAKLPSHPEKIVAGLPPTHTALRFLQVPVKQRKKVEQMYRFELEDSLPMKLSDSIVEHHISRTKEGSLVFAAIAPKKNIATQIEWLQKVGIDPDWLTFDGMGFLNLFLTCRAAEEKEVIDPTLVLDIGHQKTTLGIFNQNRLELFRSVSWGGSAINNAIALNLGVALEEAEKAKAADADLSSASKDGEKAELAASCRQALAPFIADLNQSLVGYRNIYKQGIGSIEITGGTSKLKGIEEFLSENLGGIPCKRFTPFSEMEVKEELKRNADQYRFTEPWGRAMVFARKSPLLFNFRKEDMGKTTSLSEVSHILQNPNILKLATYAAILAVMLFVHVNAASYFAQEESDKANEEIKKVFGDTFKTAPKNLRSALTSNPTELKKYIEQKNKELDQKLKMLSKNKQPMLSLVRTISDSFPKSTRVDVNKLEITDRAFVMEGALYEGALAPVTENLKKLTFLSDVEVKEQGQRFYYHGKVIGR